MTNDDSAIRKLKQARLFATQIEQFMERTKKDADAFTTNMSPNELDLLADFFEEIVASLEIRASLLREQDSDG